MRGNQNSSRYDRANLLPQVPENDFQDRVACSGILVLQDNFNLDVFSRGVACFVGEYIHDFQGYWFLRARDVAEHQQEHREDGAKANLHEENLLARG